MICPKCHVRELTEVALFSSVEHVCDFCDNKDLVVHIPEKGLDWMPFEIRLPDAKPSPWFSTPFVFTVPKTGSYKIERIALISDSSKWRRAGDSITVNISEIDRAEEVARKTAKAIAERPIHWGGICDMP